jgi:hypothetical protein
MSYFSPDAGLPEYDGCVYPQPYPKNIQFELNYPLEDNFGYELLPAGTIVIFKYYCPDKLWLEVNGAVRLFRTTRIAGLATPAQIAAHGMRGGKRRAASLRKQRRKSRVNRSRKSRLRPLRK